MRYLSTRYAVPFLVHAASSAAWTRKGTAYLSEAMLRGLAEDGGLFVPERIPKLSAVSLDGSFAESAVKVLRPFFEGDPLEEEIAEMCRTAFDFPVPLRLFDSKTAVLELFHGPTCAFKDFGARFLAAALGKLPSSTERTVLVATSGDTGGAVAAAFAKASGARVGILFPKGLISARQQKQLTTWGGNVRAFAVRGTFDDCQKLLKSAFASGKWAGLTSANSINIGRLLPQIAYFAHASEQYRKARGTIPGVIVPSGNLGNAVGAFYARAMGFPIGRIAIATNANRTLADYFERGEWKPRSSIPTLANAMDVGNPSNIERLNVLEPDYLKLKEFVIARSVSDDEIRATIQKYAKERNEVFCPHTATAVKLRETLKDGDWIIAATAHPAKFESIVEPLIGRSLPIPEALDSVLKKTESYIEIDPNLDVFHSEWIK